MGKLSKSFIFGLVSWSVGGRTTPPHVYKKKHPGRTQEKRNYMN